MAQTPAWDEEDSGLHQEDPLEKEMTTHSSMLSWGIPRTARHRSWGRKESDMAKWLTHTHGGQCWKFKKFTPSFPSCFPFFLLCFWQTLIRNPQPDTQYSTSIVSVLKVLTRTQCVPCMQGVHSILGAGRVFTVWLGVERLGVERSGSILLAEGGPGRLQGDGWVLRWEEFLGSSICRFPS